jgi:hypothetical protein
MGVGEGDRREEVRVDFVQHALSAMIRYRQMCKAPGPGCEIGDVTTSSRS